MYVNFQQKMNECDVEIEKLLKEQIYSDNEKKQHFIDKKVYKKISKNIPKNLDINFLSCHFLVVWIYWPLKEQASLYEGIEK